MLSKADWNRILKWHRPTRDGMYFAQDWTDANNVYAPSGSYQVKKFDTVWRLTRVSYGSGSHIGASGSRHTVFIGAYLTLREAKSAAQDDLDKRLREKE